MVEHEDWQRRKEILLTLERGTILYVILSFKIFQWHDRVLNIY